jgi:hypothetical protein
MCAHVLSTTIFSPIAIVFRRMRWTWHIQTRFGAEESFVSASTVQYNTIHFSTVLARELSASLCLIFLSTPCTSRARFGNHKKANMSFFSPLLQNVSHLQSMSRMHVARCCPDVQFIICLNFLRSRVTKTFDLSSSSCHNLHISSMLRAFFPPLIHVL